MEEAREKAQGKGWGRWGGEEESVGGRCRSWRIVCIYTNSTVAAASLMRSRGWVGGWAAAPPALPITHHVHQRRRRASGPVRTDVTAAPPPSGRRRRRLCEGAGSLSGPPLTLLGPTNEIASFQPFFSLSDHHGAVQPLLTELCCHGEEL